MHVKQGKRAEEADVKYAVKKVRPEFIFMSNNKRNN